MYALQSEPEAGRRCRSVVPALLLSTSLFWGMAAASRGLEQRVSLPRPLPAVVMQVALPKAPPTLEPKSDPLPEPEPPPKENKPRPTPHKSQTLDKPSPTQPEPAQASAEPPPADPAPPVAGLSPDSTLAHAAGPALPTGNTLLARATAGQRSVSARTPGGVAKGAQNASQDYSANKRRTEAKLQQGVVPEYPREAKRAGVEGVVILLLSIDERGVVSSAKVLKGLGHGLDESALRAARQTRWSPATLGPSAVKSTRAFNVRFSLQS
jgi:protein TonB